MEKRSDQQPARRSSGIGGREQTPPSLSRLSRPDNPQQAHDMGMDGALPQQLQLAFDVTFLWRRHSTKVGNSHWNRPTSCFPEDSTAILLRSGRPGLTRVKETRSGNSTLHAESPKYTKCYALRKHFRCSRPQVESRQFQPQRENVSGPLRRQGCLSTYTRPVGLPTDRRTTDQSRRRMPATTPTTCPGSPQFCWDKSHDGTTQHSHRGCLLTGDSSDFSTTFTAKCLPLSNFAAVTFPTRDMVTVSISPTEDVKRPESRGVNTVPWDYFGELARRTMFGPCDARRAQWSEYQN